MAANGTFYRMDKQDLICQIVDGIFKERMQIKKQSGEMKKNGEDTEILDNNVWALKILINSYYGCVWKQIL